jgi:hypothetical protein
MKWIFKYIHKLEKKWLDKRVYKSIWYFWIKLVVLSPLLLISLLERGAQILYKLATQGKIDRPDKPPVVLANIVQGFANLAFENEQVEAMAVKRASICAECPAAVKAGVYSVVKDNRTTNIQGMKCDDCGCNLSAKVRSVHDYCPRGKW